MLYQGMQNVVRHPGILMNDARALVGNVESGVSNWINEWGTGDAIERAQLIGSAGFTAMTLFGGAAASFIARGLAVEGEVLDASASTGSALSRGATSGLNTPFNFFRSGLPSQMRGSVDLLEGTTDRAIQTIAASSPGEIAWGYGDLSARQARILEQLPKNLSQIKVYKSDVNVTDLAALTAKTGDEFTFFTRGSQRLIVRGNSTGLNIPEYVLRSLREQGFRWSAHTHPGTSELVLNASGVPGDRYVLSIFNQNRSLILNSTGRRNVFDINNNTYINTNISKYFDFNPNF